MKTSAAIVARITLLLALFVVGIGRPAAAQLTIQFANQRTDFTTSNIYVMFGGTSSITGTILNSDGSQGTPISAGQNYSLAQLAYGVSLTEFSDGRILIALGSKFTTPNAGNGYAPNYDNPTLGDFNTRWDKVEMTYVGNSGGANLTAQDFFSVPLQLTANGGGLPTTTLGWTTPTAGFFTTAALLTGNSIISPSNPGGSVAVGAGGLDVTVPPSTLESILRVVSPGSVAPGANGVTVYPSLSPYISWLQANNVVTTIAGNNGAGQTYSFTTTVLNPSTVTGTGLSVGDIYFNGTVTNGTTSTPTSCYIPAASVTDHNIYGAVGDLYTIIEGANTSGVLDRAVADYLAGLNYGFVGSPTDNPNQPGTTVGNSQSWTWFGNNPNGQTTAKLPLSAAFAAAQPSNPYYNVYAAELAAINPGTYGFPYSDRIQNVLAQLGANSTLTVTILPDIPATTAGPDSPTKFAPQRNVKARLVRHGRRIEVAGTLTDADGIAKITVAVKGRARNYLASRKDPRWNALILPPGNERFTLSVTAKDKRGFVKTKSYRLKAAK